MNAIRPGLVTEGQFLALPETMDKVELLDGEVLISPAPSYRHQEILGRIVFELRLWQRRRNAAVTVGQSPLDVRFAPDRILQPDAFVILDRIPLDADGPLSRIPDICIEVLSSNRVHDRITKRLLYAEAAVCEYWVVEQEGPIERWHRDQLRTVEIVSARLSTPLLPDFELDLVKLFASG